MPLPPNLSAAFVETTILADTLLKPASELKKNAERALAKFSKKEVPVFALKEFKSVLQYLVWLHNCLVTEGTLSGGMRRIQRVMKNQSGRASTAMEGIATQVALVSKQVKPITASQLGLSYSPDVWLGTEIRVALKTMIFKAWVRRSIKIAMVQPLSCFVQSGPVVEKSGLIVLPDLRCRTTDCSMRKLLQADVGMLKALLIASDSQLPSLEAARRSKVLKNLLKPKSGAMSAQDCRALGDAVYAFFCPNTSAILTTNVRDHSLLAGSVGKVAISPIAVLAP